MKTLGTLVGRVAIHGALTGALSGFAVALVIVWLADVRSRRHEDETLLDVCGQFALELRERHADPVWLAKDEAWELQHTEIAVAVFERERFLAGAAALVPVPDGTCEDHGVLRICALRADALTAVVARQRASFTERNGDLLRAAWIAVLSMAVLSALSARWIANVVVRPLRELRDAVMQLSAHPAQARFNTYAGVSEVDALRLSLRDSLSRLSTTLAQSERFARDAAHELRTPLTAMIGELELIAENAEQETRDDVLRVLAIAQRQQTLVERLLVLAQPQVAHTAERVDLVDVVETAVEALSPGIRDRVTVSLPERETFVDGDSALLVSMVGNALENALKFSQREVRCTLAADERHATIAVQDEGPGIDEAERERLFLPFYRSAKARVSGVRGHGIGLALIAHVASLHGGVAHFAAATRGARLEIDLPRSV